MRTIVTAFFVLIVLAGFIQTGSAINKEECTEVNPVMMKGGPVEDVSITVEPYVQPYRGPSEILYHWDFETTPDPGDFKAVDGTDIEAKWHRQDTYNSYEGNNWWCGSEGEDLNGFWQWGYGDWWYQALDTPPLTIPAGASNPKLTLMAAWCMEGSETPGSCTDECNDWDCWTAWVKTGDDSTWIYPTGGYNSRYDTCWAYEFMLLFDRIPGFVGSPAGPDEPEEEDACYDWVPIEFPLDAYKGQEITVRIVFVSDQCYSTFSLTCPGSAEPAPHLKGIFVDNIQVKTDSGILFEDNADDKVGLIPRSFTVGNYFEFKNNDDFHSATHSWNMDIDDHPGLRTNWLETPTLDLPTDKWCKFEYWFKLDTPDFDGDHDQGLDDNYQVDYVIVDEGEDPEVIASGWTKMFHSAPRAWLNFADTTGYTETCHFETWWNFLDEDIQAQDNFSCCGRGGMSLADFAGDRVRLRFLTAADANDDCGNGTGLWLDDFTVTYITQAPFDAGVENVWPQFPNAVNLPTTVKLQLRNYGLNPVNALFFYEVQDLDGEVLLPATRAFQQTLAFDTTITYQFTWTPEEEGYARVLAYQFIPDQYPNNDSLISHSALVTPEKTGYFMDNHYLHGNITAPSVGSGPAVRLAPPPTVQPFNLTEAAFMITGPDEEAQFYIHIMGIDGDSLGPDLIDPILITCSEDHLPNLDGLDRAGLDWYGVDLTTDPRVSDPEALEGLSGEFWMWLEKVGGTFRVSHAFDPDPPSGYYYYNAEVDTFGPDTDEWGIRAMLEWGIGSACEGTRGDATGDGNINVLDVLAVANHILSVSTLQGDAYCRGDCTGDGIINILDALGVANVILGIIPACPGGGACKPVVTPETLEFMKSLESYLSPEGFARIMTLVKNEIGVVREYSLAQNYPNPFNPTTTISYQLSAVSGQSTQYTTLKIYNVLGQEVATLVDGMKPAGAYTVEWDASDMASGIYFYRLTAGDYTATRQMVLMK